MNKELGVAYGKIGVFFETRFSFTAARSTWCRANLRLAEKARPSFNAMAPTVRHAMVVYADETGGKTAGFTAWLGSSSPRTSRCTSSAGAAAST